MEKIIKSVIFDDAYKSVLEALIEQHGALEVRLFHEANNRYHDKAIAICSDLPARVVGGSELTLPASGERFQRLGYVARAEAEHEVLFERIKALALEHHTFLLRHATDKGLDLVCRKENPLWVFHDFEEDNDPGRFWEPHPGWIKNPL